MENVPKLKEMPWKERPGYIWEYYKWWFIVTAIVAVVVGSFIRSQIVNKDGIAYVMMINANQENLPEDTGSLFEDFTASQGFDTEENEVTLNAALSYSPENQDASSIYTLQSIQTIIAAQTVDVYISDQTMFDYIGGQGAFIPVSDYLTEEQLEKYKEQIVYVAAESDEIDMAWDNESEEEGTLYARGIRLTDSQWMEETGLYPYEDPVVGILANTPNGETAKNLVLYLLGETTENE